jgi:hypothetical protein
MGGIMSQTQTPPMTLKEKLAIGVKCAELEKEGKFEEAKRVWKQIPLSPHMAEWAKSHIGADFLIQYGWNLSEAETEFGKDWLTR